MRQLVSYRAEKIIGLLEAIEIELDENYNLENYDFRNMYYLSAK